MRRVVIPELLDTDSGSPAEIAASLRDLRRINAWFGGVSALADLLRRVSNKSGRRELSVLDVASGSGKVTSEAQSRLAREGLQVHLTLMDRAATHFNGAIRAVAGDALALPFSDSSFDVVVSTLFVHHLEPAEVTRFANEGLRVCRVAFVINDLIRNPLHLALTYAGLPLFSRLTRHDAPASVKRAYTVEEMRAAVDAARPRSLDISRHYLYRQGLIAWK